MGDKISIIVPTYNRCGYLPQALESVLGQTYKNTEVIVVNDGSDDQTEAALAPFSGRFRYLKKENGGKSSAVNLGLQHATGAYVWVFDDDDIACADKLARHMDLFARHPEVGFTYSAYQEFRDDCPERIVREIPAPAYPRREMLRRLLLTRNFICGVSVVVRRSCYRTAGGFDERLLRSQDYDMWIRLARHFAAGAIEVPTVKVRLHRGDRGAASDRFGFDHLPQKQHQYHRIVFKKVYDEIPLEEIFGDLSDPQAHFGALVERAWMMMKRWLFEEVEKDLREIASCLQAHPQVTIDPAARRFFCFLEDVVRQKGQDRLADLACRILEMRGLFEGTGRRPEISGAWDSVDVVFGDGKVRWGAVS